MCAIASSKHKWPPAPRVEDLRIALSYEISDASESLIFDDDESVVSRGTIDQWPIIMLVEPGPCNQTAQNNECFMPKKKAAERNMPVYRKAQDTTPHTSSLKRCQSERKPAGKALSSKPPKGDENSRIRTGPVPSKANMKYMPDPKPKASGGINVPAQNSSSKSHRKAMMPEPDGSRPRGTNHLVDYDTTAHFAGTCNQYTTDEVGIQGGLTDPWSPLQQQSDMSLDGDSRKSRRRQHAGEWHSDDEVFSSHRAGLGSNNLIPTSNKPAGREAQETRQTRKSKKDDTPDKTLSRSKSTRRRKATITEEPYSAIPDPSNNKSSSLTERRRSNSSLPRLERPKSDIYPHLYFHPTDSSKFDSPSSLAPVLPGKTYEATLMQQTTFPPISFNPKGQEYNTEGWEYVSPVPYYEGSAYDPLWSASAYPPTADIMPQFSYMAHQENAMQPQPSPVVNSSLVRQDSKKRSQGTTTSKRQMSPRQKVDDAPVSLAPCPRSIAIAGYSDWSTIMGLTHLTICPSCTKQIAETRFETLIIAAPAQPLGLPVRCSFSQPWARLAWVQTMKLGSNHLELLYQLTRPSSIYRQCPGRSSSIQTWYRIIDPETGRLMPNFSACAACFRNVRILMPSLRDSFQPSSNTQERTCDLQCGSTRFIQYLDLLDVAATRHQHDPGHKPDLREFARYAKRKDHIYDCPRDHLVVGPWHGIDELPEFTICEDCYDDVVWPFGNSPVASLVSQTVLTSSDNKTPLSRQASCQLYSPRMRTLFREAVRRSDFGYLSAAVRARFQAEIAFRENKKLLLEDVSVWYDRDAELRKNAAEWKRWE